jgi:homoserine O-acetyltransferase/O-succinyltransferase
METKDYYSQQNHGPYQIFDLDDFPLENGGIISACQIAYSTFGQLNNKKDNTILITTWYSGTSKIMEQGYIGPGRAIDPAEYFIVIVNQIGNGLSTSPSNAPSHLHGLKFPHVTIADDVRAQHELLTNHFGIETLALVIGGSMGAQQTWEWAVRYPEMVKRAAPIAGRSRSSEHDFLFIETFTNAIQSDPLWKNGNFAKGSVLKEGLCHHADLWSAMGFSVNFFNRALYKNLGFASLEQLRSCFTQNYFLPMDANNLLTMAWKWQHADVSRQTNGDLALALQRVHAVVFVIAIDQDMLCPPSDCQVDQELTPKSQLKIIHSDSGHLALFGFEPSYVEQLDIFLRELLGISLDEIEDQVPYSTLQESFK